MTKEEQLSTANELLNYLRNYNPDVREIMSIESQIKLKNLWLILNGTQANTGCGSCVLHYLTQIEAWYQREKPVNVEEQIETPPTVKKVKGCSSCKQKKQK